MVGGRKSGGRGLAVGFDSPPESAAPVLPAGHLPEPVKDYPVTSIPDDAPSSEEIAASFEMLANFFGTEYPRDAVRRVLRIDSGDHRQGSGSKLPDYSECAGHYVN